MCTLYILRYLMLVRVLWEYVVYAQMSKTAETPIWHARSFDTKPLILIALSNICDKRDTFESKRLIFIFLCTSWCDATGRRVLSWSTRINNISFGALSRVTTDTYVSRTSDLISSMRAHSSILSIISPVSLEYIRLLWFQRECENEPYQIYSSTQKQPWVSRYNMLWM